MKTISVAEVVERLCWDGFSATGGDEGPYISVEWNLGSAELLRLTSVILASGYDFVIVCGTSSSNLEICLVPFNK